MEYQNRATGLRSPVGNSPWDRSLQGTKEWPLFDQCRHRSSLGRSPKESMHPEEDIGMPSSRRLCLRGGFIF